MVYNVLIGRLMLGLGIGHQRTKGEKGESWRGEIISKLSPSLISAFIRGLFDGDGHATDTHILITTATHRGAQHIFLLLKKLGISTYITEIKRGYQVGTKNFGDYALFRKIISSGDSLFAIGFKIAANNLKIPDEKSYVDAIEIKYQKYKKIWEGPIVDTQRQGDINWYFQSTHNSFIEVKSSINNLMSLNNQVMFQTATNMKNKAKRAIMPGVVAIISALVFSLLFNFFIEYYFISPIIVITKNIKRFLENKKPFRIEVETKDEIFDLSVSINKLCALVKD